MLSSSLGGLELAPGNVRAERAGRVLGALCAQVERNTVWRDMVAMERRTVAATVEPTIKKESW